MDAPINESQARAMKASWISLFLALGCAFVFFAFLSVDRVVPFARTRQGLLTGLVPRTGLYALWAGEALAAAVGLVSFLLIRRDAMPSKAISGIVGRSLCGIAIGALGAIFLWLVVGHIVVGF